MIVVVDYGMGNLRSIAQALEEVGATVRVTNSPEAMVQATHIVLPGVGAFRDGMAALQNEGLDRVLTQEVCEKGKPFLGICLGMQLIADCSEEFGEHEGLHWIPAVVRRLSPGPENLRIPHVGWNTVRFAQPHPLWEGLREEADFYFVHSYHVMPNDPQVVAGVCSYGDDVVAAVARGNIAATQFHPEKSQRDGLRILKNFLHWSPC